MANPNFFYDEQIRRFLLQFARMFSNFEVEYGVDGVTKLPTYMRVPVRYGDASRQAQTIMQQNSQNNVPCAPQMSFYITDLKYDRKRVQEPHHVDRRNVRQREWNEDSQTYEETQGNAFTVERPMPTPYELSLNLDIWTTNTNMKMQLLEQILPLFNPSLEIQSTDNYLDWTSLSVVEIDNVKWSSRSVPQNDNNIDIATLSFKLPIWISPPARVTKEGVIHKVIASVYDEDGIYVDAISSDDLLLGTRIKITPHGYQILLLGNELRILPVTEPLQDDGVTSTVIIPDSDINWHGVIDEYGVLNDGITQIRLESEEMDEADIIGTVAYHPADDNILLFAIDPDTLNSNTLPPIDAVIDPLASGPGSGLPAAANGQRYLLTEDTNLGDTAAWNGPGSEFIASKNDVIEFNSGEWNVVFHADSHPTKEYITNATTNDQFKWKKEDGEWARSYEGIYPGGRWGLVL